jgi:hypothetical protein
MIGNCPLIQEWDFTVPSFAPAGDAILSWTWVNLIGNREFYQTCAWVNVQQPTSSRIKKRAVTDSTSFDQLPTIWKANMVGVNSCNTVEGSVVNYANPGSDVYYGPGQSASNPITEPNSDCDSPTPHGQLYQDLSVSGSDSNPPIVPAIVSGVLSAVGGVFAEGPSSSNTPATYVNTPTATTTTTTSTTSISVVTASKPVAFSAPPIFTTLATTVSVATNASVAPTASAAPAAPLDPAPVPAGPIAFANKSNLSQYLPCMAGSFLCLSATEFLICDYAAGGNPSKPPTYFVGGPQQVAAGMQCIPYEAPLPTGAEAAALQVGQAPAVSVGKYRADRYASL